MKTYEGFLDFFKSKGVPLQQLKVGDYISFSVVSKKISNTYFRDKEITSTYDEGKIIKKEFYETTKGIEYFFHILSEDGQIKATGLKNNTRVEYLTPEEIEEFEFKLQANKYNL